MLKFNRLADAVEVELAGQSAPTVSLNFKLEGIAAGQFEAVARKFGKTNTDMAKFILSNALPDVIKQLGLPDNPEPTKGANDVLEEKLIETARPLIKRLTVGDRFELKQLLGECWIELEGGERNRAGRIFKRLVSEGAIPNVRFVVTQSNNHALYERMAS
jgi:hypothetical protein